MADDKTRTDVVEENDAATIAKYGEEAWPQIIASRLNDINLSLAALVDAGSGE